MAKALRLSGNSGALIAGVQPDAPAAGAGLEPGDVITSVNGQAVKNPHELALNIASVQPGDEAKLQVVHNGETKTVTVKVGQLPNEKVASNDQVQEPKERIGLALAPLSPELRNRLDVPDGTRGAVVRNVEPGSPSGSGRAADR